jgi:hypothetical protein
LRAADPRELLRLATSAAWQTGNPRAGLLLSQLTERCTVAFSDQVETARILPVGSGHRVELSRAFLEKWIETPGELLFLLLHEVLHRVRGDLLRSTDGRRDPVGRFLENLVADVGVNGWLLRSGFFPGGMPLLERFYGDGSFPSLLLVPPDRILGPRAVELGLPAARGAGSLAEVDALPRRRVIEALARVFRKAGRGPRDSREIAAWHADAWLNEDQAHEGLFARLRKFFPRDGDAPSVVFLGDHGLTRTACDPGTELGALVEAIEGGVDVGVREDHVVPALPASVEALRRRIAAALTSCARVSWEDQTPLRGVVPAFGRREVFLLAGGWWPVFFPQAAPDENAQAVRVYLDVSGSTLRVQPILYGVLRGLGRLVAEPVNLFSNRVVEITLEELRRGRRVTTHGTDFDCVAEHALRARHRRILVVTDGQGGLSQQNANRASAAGLEIFVLLTASCPSSPLPALAKTVWEIPGDVLGGGRVERFAPRGRGELPCRSS